MSITSTGAMTAPTAADSDLTTWDPIKSGQQQKLGELVQYFQAGITTNMDNMPISYIDPTIIAPLLLDVDGPDDVPDDTVREATQPIEFHEGFPTVGGIPLWERLDGEPIPYYKLFKEYRDLRYVGGIGQRAIAKVADRSNMPGRHLNALARVYHWQLRVRCYDIYKEIERQLSRQAAAEKLESKHSAVSSRLLDQAVDYLETHPEQMSTKNAITLVEMAMKAGRLAIGLNPDKPGSGNGNGNDNTGNNQTNITIANNSGNGAMLVGGSSSGNGPGGGNGQGTLGNTNGAGQAKETQHLRDILNVLGRSGAFDAAHGTKPQEIECVVPEIIDIHSDEVS